MSNRATEDAMNVMPANGLATLDGDDVTHVIFILDRSGSMAGKEADVIGGFNAYVDKLREAPHGRAGVSYVRFDNVVELVWNDVELADVPAMTAETYAVRGNTALLDAFGMTVSAVKDRPEHTYVVITHTDGQENASREWTAEAVKALIERCEAKGNWTFSFFGEGVAAWAQAGDYGFAGGRSAMYTQRDTQDMYAAQARVSNVMRSRKMRMSKDFASATAAAMDRPDMSDEEIASKLEADDASAPKGK